VNLKKYQQKIQRSKRFIIYFSRNIRSKNHVLSHKNLRKSPWKLIAFLSELPFRSKRNLNVSPFRGFSQLFKIIYITYNVKEGSAEKNPDKKSI
jgi:hypothetical protein